jgi:hypothetical protein
VACFALVMEVAEGTGTLTRDMGVQEVGSFVCLFVCLFVCFLMIVVVMMYGLINWWRLGLFLKFKL